MTQRHKAIVAGHDLENHQVFHEMHPPVMGALGGKTAAFGGYVLVVKQKNVLHISQSSTV